MENVLLRNADADDEWFLKELFFDIRSVEFIQIGFPLEQLTPLLSMQYNAQTKGYNTQYPNAENSIIEMQGDRIGRLLVNRYETNIYLIDIAITHNFRGKGIGSFLLGRLKTESETVKLSVYKTNFGAIKLYEKHGFAVSKDDGMHLEMEWKNVG
jgi:ribosomal protein S18 acetylase RimI-like enzyme